MRVLSYLLLVITIAGLLIGVGVNGAWSQQRMLRSYQPVPASVQESGVASSPLGGYAPSVSYSYVAAGKTQHADRVAPLSISGSREWAESISNRARSETTTAYVNPNDPADAYLLPIGCFRPYGLILAGLLLLGLSILPLRRGGVFEHQPVSVTAGPYDWYELTPEGTPTDQTLAYLAISAVWYLLGGMAIAHYYLTIPPDYEIKAMVFSAIFAAAGLWPLYRAAKTWCAASHVTAPKARMTRNTVHLDEPIIVRIEQPFVRDTTVRQVRVALCCTRRNGLGSVKYFTASHAAAENRAVRHGETIEGEFTFEVPEKKRHPSTPFSRWQYPRTDWQIEITTRTDKASSTTTFPILAEHTPRRTNAKAA